MDSPNQVLDDIIASRVADLYGSDYEGDMEQVRRGHAYRKQYGLRRKKCDITLANVVEERMKRENPGWVACQHKFAGHVANVEHVFVYLLMPEES